MYNLPEFQNVTPHTSGEFSPPSSGGSKVKFNKKKLLLYGGLGVAAFLLISSLFKKPQSDGTEDTASGGAIPVGDAGLMPTNSVDVAAQMQNMQSLMEDAQDQKFQSLSNDLSTSNAELVTNFSGLLTDTKSQYEQQLQDQTDKFNSFVTTSNEADQALADQYATDKAAAEKAVSEAQKAAEKASDDLTSYKSTNDKALTDAQNAAKKAADDLASYKKKDAKTDAATKKANDKAIADANKKVADAKKAADAASAKAKAAATAAAKLGAKSSNTKSSSTKSSSTKSTNKAPAPAPSTKAPSTKASTYTIHKGDTLSAIAAKNHTTVAVLAKANGIKNPDKIYAGDKIKIVKK